MSQSLATRTVETSSGQTASMPFNLESSNSYYYPLVQDVPGELGGCSVYYLSCAASTNLTQVKTSAGQLYGFFASNVDSVPVYLRFYNLSSAPVLGTSTTFLNFEIPQSTTPGDGLFASMWFPCGIAFSAGITFSVATPWSDAATTGNLTASTVKVNIFYK